MYIVDFIERLIYPINSWIDSRKTYSKQREKLVKMGFTRSEADSIITYWQDYSLTEFEPGQLIWRYAKLKNLNLQEAGFLLSIGKGWYKLSKEANNLGVGCDEISPIKH